MRSDIRAETAPKRAESTVIMFFSIVVHKDRSDLIDKGLIEMIGKGRGSYYKLRK